MCYFALVELIFQIVVLCLHLLEVPIKFLVCLLYLFEGVAQNGGVDLFVLFLLFKLVAFGHVHFKFTLQLLAFFVPFLCLLFELLLPLGRVGPQDHPQLLLVLPYAIDNSVFLEVERGDVDVDLVHPLLDVTFEFSSDLEFGLKGGLAVDLVLFFIRGGLWLMLLGPLLKIGLVVGVVHDEGLGYVVGLVAELVHPVEEVVQPTFLSLVHFDGLVLGDDVGGFKGGCFLGEILEGDVPVGGRGGGLLGGGGGLVDQGGLLVGLHRQGY